MAVVIARNEAIFGFVLLLLFSKKGVQKIGLNEGSARLGQAAREYNEQGFVVGGEVVVGGLTHH